MIEAKVIQDSLNWNGDRLTTMEVTFHRFVLAEFNTHRVFSRNSASSRAIPVEKQIKKIFDSPAFPVEFGTRRAGMQAGPPLKGWKLWLAKTEWKRASRKAIRSAKRLSRLGVHKQVTNRILEPFMWHTVIVSSTEWDNFFAQRNSSLAQPEIHMAAAAMEKAYRESTPTFLVAGQWHLPYITDRDKIETANSFSKLAKISAARCARVSYLTHDGVRDIQKDLELYDRLVTANPPHWSPLEHVATPLRPQESELSASGNFTGFAQLRHNFHLI